MQDRLNKQTQALTEPKKDEDDPFSMLKKKKPKVKAEGDSPDKKDEDGNSSARKSNKKKKGPNILRGIASNKDLEMKEDGTVPKVIVKENNEAVDLLK